MSLPFSSCSVQPSSRDMRVFGKRVPQISHALRRLPCLPLTAGLCCRCSLFAFPRTAPVPPCLRLVFSFGMIAFLPFRVRSHFGFQRYSCNAVRLILFSRHRLAARVMVVCGVVFAVSASPVFVFFYLAVALPSFFLRSVREKLPFHTRGVGGGSGLFANSLPFGVLQRLKNHIFDPFLSLVE